MSRFCGQDDPFERGSWDCVQCFVERHGWFPWTPQGLAKLYRSTRSAEDRKSKGAKIKRQAEKKAVRQARLHDPVYRHQADVAEAILRTSLSNGLPSLHVPNTRGNDVGSSE